MKIHYLNDEQHSWVESTLQSITMEQRVGMLLCPEDRKYSTQDWLDIFAKVPLGNIFLGGQPADALKESLTRIQKQSPIPVTVAVDMESGCGVPDFGTNFSSQMAHGAADNTDLTFETGRMLAREMRSMGLHWTFSPVADINLNFNNPVTNTRAYSDNADMVARHIKAAVLGRQQDALVAATVKHFPGDGVDDRDQHLCTSVNSLPMDQWWDLYGNVWRTAIDDAGVMSIMGGHISLPAYQGFAVDPQEAMPATLCKKLQIDLLRKELGFRGVLVSDAAPMIGFMSRTTDEDAVVDNIVTGSDVFLFADPVKDFSRLMKAVKSGRLSEERVDESVRRVLEMKARLNLHHTPFGESVPASVSAGHKQTAQKLADASVTLLKDDHTFPRKLKPGARILTVTVNYDKNTPKQKDLDVVDEELRARGFTVDHLLRPSHNDLLEKAGDYDAVFVNLQVTMHMKIGTLRMTAEAVMPFWRAFYTNFDHIVFTSFGNPYALYEQPHLPNMLTTYGPDETAQRAAVKAWLGEIPCAGTCPVRLPKIQIKRFE